MFPNMASEFVYIRTYSRWIEQLNRRETWPETVERYINFIVTERGERIPPKVINNIRERILKFEVMPSMRALWAAGEAARQDNTTMYNCSFEAINSPESFAEGLYVLMCGTGFGFRVSKHLDVEQLPVVEKNSGQSSGTFVVPDDKAGWADSVKKLVLALYSGSDLDMDYTRIRKKGAKLKTMGGRASGPEPLVVLHHFIREVFNTAQGRKLTTLELHDICNQIAEIVVVGGVRRSSEVSLSDLDDEEMRYAKMGNFPVRRYMANNSAIYYEKPTAVQFLKEWSALAESGSGERGIFNLGGARARAPKRRDASKIEGGNPCMEIMLRSKQFCNLSEVVIRPTDDLDDLLDKVEVATWIGVIQSSFTYFPYLSPEWKANCEEERLLGVSLTGQMDNPELMIASNLQALKKRALKVAKSAAEKMGIQYSTSITCTKPSGTVSQVCDSASGLHTRFSPFYIRRYRISATDPLYKMMKDQGFQFSPENGQRKSDWAEAEQGNTHACSIYQKGKKWDESYVTTWVVSFPVKAPEQSVTRNQRTAIDQLEYYKMLQANWCEHNASATIYVKDEEWFEVGNWVYKNWDYICGVSFLPFDGGNYQQAPYEEIDEEKYEAMLKQVPTLDLSKLHIYEKEDTTEGAKSLACSGDSCELIL